MQTSVHQAQTALSSTPSILAKSGCTLSRPRYLSNQLQDSLEYPGHEQLPPIHRKELETKSPAGTPPRFRQDFSRISVHPPSSSFRHTRLQSKLSIGASNDPLEREADQVANQVLAAPLNPTIGITPPRIQRYAGQTSDQTTIATASVDRVLASQGRPLAPTLQQDLGQRFGHDFSQVRVHCDAAANQSARDVNAHAYTAAQNIVFATGRFAPGTREGRRLLAHELTHVVQQGVGAQRQFIQREAPTEAEKKEAEEKARLIAALVADYGLAGVEDGSGTWTADHLQQVTDAFKLVTAGDKIALNDVVLSRVTSLGGKTAGRFRSKLSVNDTTVVNEATLELADLAFSKGAPDSYGVIVHEVGHAVASLPLRTVTHAEHLATAEANRLVEISNPTVDALNAAVEISNATVDPFNDAANEFNAANQSGDAGRIATAKADYEAKKADYETKTAETERLRKISDTALEKTAEAKALAEEKELATVAKQISAGDLDKIKTSAESAATAHQKSVKAAKGKLEAMSEEAKTESAAYRAALEAASTAITDFTTKTKDQQMSESDVETAIAETQTKLDERDSQRQAVTNANKDNAALSILTSQEQAQNDWFAAAKAHSLAHNRNARVQKFVKFVESKGIAPITPYAAENWPHKPEEFYAEAYSMYFSNPDNLETTSLPLFEWFKDNKY